MTRILVTTGPEASGKTTLATDLSLQLPAPLVPEAARNYLTALYQDKPGARYRQSDLLEIARLQVEAEATALAARPEVLVCDTDLLVILIWSEVVFGSCTEELLALFASSLQQYPRRYLLCDPGIPWQSDPLRENPHDRAQLFLRYRERLELLKLSYLHVQGSMEQRLEQAVRFMT